MARSIRQPELFKPVQRVLLLPGGEPFSFHHDFSRKPLVIDSDSIAIQLESMPLISFDTLYRGHRTLPWNVLVVPCHFLIDYPRPDFSQPLLACGPAVMALACFESGADDFMRDGWNLQELEARLHHLLVPELFFMEGRIRLRGSTLSLEFPEGRGASIQLDAAEMSMLERLMRKPNRIVPFELLDGPELAPAGAAEAAARKGKSLAMRILRLKATLASLDPRLPDSIQSIRNLGYMWKTC